MKSFRRRGSVIPVILITIGICLSVYYMFIIQSKHTLAFKDDVATRITQTMDNQFGGNVSIINTAISGREAKIRTQTMDNQFGGNVAILNTSISGRENKIRTHVFNASNEDEALILEALKYQCVQLRTPVQKSTICVYPKEKDVYVSGSIISGGLWESNLVSLIESLIRNDPGMSFLDLGCNIGMFTIYFARLGHRVVSVDPNKLNLMLLSRSLEISHLQKNVTLIWNAISDVHEKVTFTKYPDNVGGWSVHAFGNETIPDESIDAITLDDIAFLLRDKKVFVKMDIETAEFKAVNGASEFFKVVDVRYVLMEFVAHRKTESGKKMFDIMTSYGFLPYKPQVPLDSLDVLIYSKWPDNVLWSKR